MFIPKHFYFDDTEVLNQFSFFIKCEKKNRWLVSVFDTQGFLEPAENVIGRPIRPIV